MAPRPSASRRLATTVLAPVAALTLMACYGAPPCQEQADKDKDGYFVCVEPKYGEIAERDCNDNDPNIHPGAPDPLGDGVDQDCDEKDGPRSGAKSSASAQGTAATAPSSSVTTAPTNDASAAPPPLISASASTSASASARPR